MYYHNSVLYLLVEDFQQRNIYYKLGLFIIIKQKQIKIHRNQVNLIGEYVKQMGFSGSILTLMDVTWNPCNDAELSVKDKIEMKPQHAYI